jgi:hypothetical protein
MATSYSTNLALTLQGTGDNPGTWGNITNTNLGTLIEQAISGYVTQAVATGTDTTITIPNGSTGVARNMYIELTGTGGTNTNLIVPSNKKLYFIYNNTSSGQVTVKVSGQTGVSVANGEKVILVSNGTDIVTAAGSNLIGETTTSLTAFGVNAGDSATSGSGNVTVGYNAGTGITTGSFHTFIGDNAGAAVTSNLASTIVGYDAGSQYARSNNNYFGALSGRNMDSTYNCGFGYLAVRGDGVGATGGANCGFGNETLPVLTTGASNTAVGNFAGGTVTTGSNNILIGYSAQTGSASGNNRIVIGVGVQGTANERITIGTTLGNTAELDLDGSDTSWAASSDGRLKENVQTSNIGLDLIASLRPVSYQWKKCKDIDPDVPGYIPEYNPDGTINPDSERRIHGDGDSVYFGFIAQEARDAIVANNAEIVRMVKQQENSIMTVAPGALIPALVKAIQELKAEFDEYKRTHP